jgi:3'(2'), 5'-bisphosphate nucleotidase
MFEQLLSRVMAIAIDAGRAIMEIYEQPAGNVVLKSDQSPLTEADLASHRIIVDGLSRLQPEWPVLSEESTHISSEQRCDWQRFWLVDPLDGTKEFLKHNGEFTVNIALIDNGSPVLGIVYAPALHVCYAGAKGAGSYVQRGDSERQRIEVKRRQENEPLRVVASRSHSDPRTAALLEQLGDHECISMGSSLKLCLVAEGAAHLYPRLGPTMEWDTAAAHAVVNEAGGMVCDLSGRELDYNKADLHNPEFFVLGKTEQSMLTTIRHCI